MIANYGYSDGSGTYYITVDTDKCDGCGKCVKVCPQKILVVEENRFDPIDGGIIAAVKEDQRKKIKYSCMPCKSDGSHKEPCKISCPTAAITHSW